MRPNLGTTFPGLLAIALPLLCGCKPGEDNNGIAEGYEAPPSSLTAGAPAMCPWRDPARDLRAFFPTIPDTTYKQESLILSPLRLEIMKRLGPGVPLESNTLYVYRVRSSTAKEPGTILVRRAGGEFGAIEIVLAVDPKHRVVGVRLQRHREPPVVAGVVASPEWLGAFRGRSADDPLRVGADLPPVSTEARISAEAVAQAVRSLLIEYTVAVESRRGDT